MTTKRKTAGLLDDLHAFIVENALLWFYCACIFFVAFIITLLRCLCCMKSNCSKKNRMQPARASADGAMAEKGAAGVAPNQLAGKLSLQEANKDSKRVKDAKISNDTKGRNNFQIPVGEKVVDRKDPNYQSLKGITNDVFDKKKDEAGLKKPKEDRNNYETLDNVDREEKETATQKEEKKLKFRQPDKVVKVGSKDPQYETLAGIDEQQVFKKKEDGSQKSAAKDADALADRGKTAAGSEEPEGEGEESRPKKVPFKRPEMVKVSAKNPQYETFADLADDFFKNKKK